MPHIQAAGVALGLGIELLAACNRTPAGTMGLPTRPPTASGAVDQPPVATNPVSPVEYPSALLDKGIEGRVLLRLYVDTAGRVVADSTRVAESSGYPAFD